MISIKSHKADRESSKAFELYHDTRYKADYDKIIEISLCRLFSAKDLETLQLTVLKILHRREIVIETLPTSNVRIGHYIDYSSYHLWNWIRWEKEGYQIPPIVIGSDTGIFATNIYNEYAHIYCNLTHHGNLTNMQAMDVIKRLDEN